MISASNVFFLLFSTTTLAGPLTEAQGSFAQPDPPFMAVSCAPLGPILQASAAFEPLLARSGGGDARAWTFLLSPDAAQEAGVDGGGALSLAQWPDHLVITLPFAGDTARARELLARVAPEAQITETETGWSVQGEQRAMTASLNEGALRMEIGVPARGRPADMGALFAGLGDEPGCVGATTLIPTSKKNQPTSVLISLPSQRSSASIRLTTAEAPASALRSSQPSKVQVHTRTAPMAVLTLGVDPLALIEDLPSLPPKAPRPEDLEKLRSQVSVPPGATLGVFPAEHGVNLAIAVPIASASGRKMSAKKISAAMHKAEDGPEWTDSLHFHATDSKTPMLGALQNGRLLVASDPELLEELEADEGAAWITPELSALRDEWPVALLLHPPPGLTRLPQIPLLAGLRTTADYWEITATNAEAQGSSSGVVLGGAIATWLVPQFIHTGQRAMRSEVPVNIDEIYTAELAYDAAFDVFVPTGVSPRPVAALTKLPVAWVDGEDWRQLGWRPDGEVRGVYWVEVDTQTHSFTVHGMVDADGDGVPAHYQRALGEPMKQVSGKDIY